MGEIKIEKNILIPGAHGKPVLTDVFRPASGEPAPVVIFSHGFKGFKDWGGFNLIADKFAQENFMFVKFNFAYNGTTPESPYDFVDLDAFGKNNFSKEVDDLGTVLNWIENNASQLNADLSRIFLIGHSRGSGISLIRASEDERVKAVAGWASVAGFDRHVTRQAVSAWKSSGVLYVENSRTGQQMPLYLQLYYDFMENHRRYDVASVVKKLDKPAILIHAENDDTIEFEQIREIASNNELNVRFIRYQSGGHTFDMVHPLTGVQLPEIMQDVVNETIDFFKNLDF